MQPSLIPEIPSLKRRTCFVCKQSKSLEEFARNRNRVLGRASYCKPCFSAKYTARGLEKRREYTRKNGKANYRKYRQDPEKVERARNVNRKSQRHKLYGITPEEYVAMYEAQDGRCAICREPPSHKVLHVDHSHTTQKVRGLLCHRCNIGIGQLKEDPNRLRAALAYLESRS